MRRFFFFILLSFFLSFINSASSTNKKIYVTNEVYGRFGNQLVSYIKAKWIAHKYSIPFLLTDFSFSNQLELSNVEKKLDRNNKKIIKICNEEDLLSCLKNSNHKETILEISYYYNFDNTWKNRKDSWNIEKWQKIKNDVFFMSFIKKLIQPKEKISFSKPPKDLFSIAIHVRKGSGTDSPLLSQQFYNIKNLPIHNAKDAFDSTIYKKYPYSDCHWPLIFVPDQFYIDAIKKISEYFHHPQMYVHIFTDDKNPIQIMKNYEEKLQLPNVIFNTNKIENQQSNILEDFFSMQNFDCLIRTRSTFSQMSDLLGNVKFVCYPNHAIWIKDVLFVDEISFSEKKLQ